MLKNLTFNATNPFQLNKTALLIGESKRKKKSFFFFPFTITFTILQ